LSQKNEEDSVRKGIILTIAGLVLLAGCGHPADKNSATAAQTKWKGAPYRLTIDTKANKPNPAVITVPSVDYTANPEALETRALLVMKFTAPGAKGSDPVERRMIGTPVDIHGEQGTLPADYMDRESKALSDYLSAACIQGKVTVSMALARSSLNPQATDAEVDAKRLSDWLPFDVVSKKPHSKC
jgi:hypothetical protein